MNRKHVSPLPFPYYYFPILILSLGGLADAIYLSISHYRVYTDIGYSSFCALSQSINCDTVSQSPYSILLNVPVPIWGAVGYFSYLLLVLKARIEWRKQKDGWVLLQLIAFIFSCYSVLLAFISTYYVQSYCAMCIVSYAINLLLLFYTWVVRNRFRLLPVRTGFVRDIKVLWHSKISKLMLSLLLGAAIAGITAFPPYWQYTSDLSLDSVATGTTEDGHPWIGATDPVLEIIEYTDYLCFQCRKMHNYLRRMIAKHPDRIRLVHRHFPMDSEFNPIVKEPFHVGSGRMAILAIYATEKGRFWPMNDALFASAAKHGEISLSDLSEKSGVSVEGMQTALAQRTDLYHNLSKDIWDGIKLEITGTPAYVVDGQVYLSHIPPEIISKALP